MRLWSRKDSICINCTGICGQPKLVAILWFLFLVMVIFNYKMGVSGRSKGGV